jgi:hypothetical protein
MQEIVLTQNAASEFEVDASAVSDGHKAQERIASLVEKGKSRVGFVIDKILGEIPVDRLVPAREFNFVPDLPVSLEFRGAARQTLHRHALTQAAEIAKVPMAYVDHLTKISEPELLAHNFNELFRRSPNRHLVRSVDDHARAIVSDRFRRIDSRPTVEALLGTFAEVGLAPYEGRFLETKVEIQAIYPKLYSPFPGELCAFGLSYRNSDYGDGSFAIRAFILRPACANGLVVENLLREVHNGKRLAEDITYAEETYLADGKATALAARDVVRNALSPAKIEEQLLRLKAAHETKVSPKGAEDALRRRGLTVEESKKVAGHFESPDIVTLPPSHSVLRMSNAISWLANTTTSKTRAQELQDIAGNWLATRTAS